MIKKLIDFLQRDIWRIRLKNYPRGKSFLLKQLRIIILSVRGFAEDKCKFRASALTFFTLLSIVPVFAMMFGIAKGFGLEEKVENLIKEKVQIQQYDPNTIQMAHQDPNTAQGQQDPNAMGGPPQIAEKLIEFSKSLLENAQGGLIAGIGVGFLLWTIIKLLGNIERSFNDIWGIKKSRSFGRKLSDYLSVMLLCPILLVMASSATVFISTEIRQIVNKYEFISQFSFLIFPLLKLMPYCILWFIFTFLFIFMPNTKVKFSAGLTAGIIAGTIFQLAQWGYIEFQVGVGKLGAIYGSFAALPLFLIWLQISWFIVLFGAELSFAHQNVDTYEFEPDCLSVSYSYKRLLSLVITNMIVKDFCNGNRPMSASDVAHKLEMPIRLVRQILFDLVEAGVLSEVKIEEEKVVAYQPARDVEDLTIRFVVDALEHKGIDEIPVQKTEEYQKLNEHLEGISKTLSQSPDNVLIKNI